MLLLFFATELRNRTKNITNPLLTHLIFVTDLNSDANKIADYQFSLLFFI